MSKEVVKIGDKSFTKEAFMIEDEHPVIGRILIVEGVKYKVLDPKRGIEGHRSGTFIKPFTEEDEERIREYEDTLEELSNLLADKVDLKRMIKENLTSSTMGELKTGLYILKSQEEGKKVEENHISGCYQLDFHLGKQTFTFLTGADVHPRDME